MNSPERIDFLAGDSEMAKRMREFDFCATPLGPVSGWPQSLRSVVNICLTTHFPIVLFWGPKLAMLYNDAYIPMLADKHPWALGKTCEAVWNEIFDVIGPLLFEVMKTGVPFSTDDFQFIMQRKGYKEETHFQFSCGAARDESGAVGGIFCAAVEITDRVFHERRLAALSNLKSDAKIPVKAAEDAVQVLDGYAIDIPFSLVYLISKDGKTASLAGCAGLPAASGAAPVTVDLTAANDMGWPLHQAAASGEAAVVSDLQSLFGDIPARHWPDPPHSAAVLPLMQPGGQAAAGLLVLGISPRRAFDDAYRRFFELASQKIASMIANADAFEQERRRAETPAELDRAKTNCFSRDLIPDSVFELVHRAFQADGTLGGTHSRAVPLLDAAGGTVERIGTASDITRRKQAEGIMYFQAHMLASLQEAICAVDENFMITFWNGMAEKIFGWTAREAVGSPSKEIFKMVSPSNREESIANILKNNGYTGEAVYRNKYGKEVHTSVICSVMRDAKGIYKGNVSSFRDITERMQMEEALHEKTRQLDEANRQKEDILESISDCFYVLDKDLRFTYVNKPAEEIWGLSRADLIGRKIEDIFPGIIDISLSKFHQVLREGKKQHYEVYSKVIQRWGDMGVYPVRNGISVYFRDTTERKMAQEALRESEEHQAFLLKLSDTLRPLSDALEIQRAAMRIVGEHLGVDCVMYNEITDGGKTIHIEDNYVSNGYPKVVGDFPVSRFGAAMDVLRRGEILAIDDRTAFALKMPAQREASMVLGVYASATVPLIKEGRWVANFSAIQARARKWTKNEIAVLKDTAERTWGAVERAKVEGAWRESERKALALVEELKALKDNLSNQVNALNRLQDISSCFIQKGNIHYIYNETLKAAVEFTNADFGHIQISRDDGRLEIIAAQGFGDAFLQYFRFADGSYTACAEAAKEGKRTITRNIAKDPAYIGTPGLKMHLDEGIACIQSTALFGRSGKPLGMLSTHYKQEHSFSEQELILLDIFARQAADVIEREQYEEALHKTYLREKVLGELSNRLLESEDPQAIMEEICRKSIGYVECDVFINYIAEKGNLRLNAYSGISKEDAERIKYPEYSEVVCGRTAAEVKGIVIPDVQNSTDPRAQLVKPFGVRSYASFPLKSDDHVIGTLLFGSRKRKVFTEDELLFMNIVSGHIAIAINRLIILEALRESEKKALILVSELEKANENKNQFISVLSHELRNPLAAILAGIQVLELTKDIGQAREVEEIINRQTKQLCKLVDDLLELTRISQNKIKLKKENINLNEIINGAAGDIRFEYEKKGVKLETKIQSRPVRLNADPVRVTQAVGNILYNALKFTQAGGTVRITLTEEKNDAVISVKDNGIGISQEILPQLFTPFKQADNTLDRNGGGLGLGLSIVKGIVDLHEGSVTAYSEGLGKGSTFTIRLPVTPEEDSKAEKPAPGKSSGKRSKLLIIEDNRDFAGLLSKMLSMTGGYSVDIAYDGIEGVKLARQIKPDIIFCDIGLPGMNGYDVAKSVRNDDIIKDTHLIALTGYAGEGEVERILKAGFDKHLAKPVDFATLKTVL